MLEVHHLTELVSVEVALVSLEFEVACQAVLMEVLEGAEGL